MQVIRANRSTPLISGPACLVLVHAGAVETAQIGHRFELLAGQLIIGRGADADIQVDLDAVSRRHARLQLDGGRFAVADLSSTNGTYVNEQPISEEAHPLKDGDEIRVGIALLRFLCGADLVFEYIEELRRLSISDGLTRTANRRHLSSVLDREVGRAGRHQRPLSLLYFVISKFGAVNENHGFLAGAHVIREVARRTAAGLRPDDLLAHFGEGRFAVVLPETDKEAAQKLASQIGEAVAQTPVAVGEEQLPVTLAIAAAALEKEGDGAALLRAAEEQIPPADRR